MQLLIRNIVGKGNLNNTRIYNVLDKSGKADHIIIFCTHVLYIIFNFTTSNYMHVGHVYVHELLNDQQINTQLRT